jgi:glycine cleavage system H lipoate-binding protein
MMIVKMIGGLGNQMFQYAFYEWLRENSDDTVLIDISHFKNYKLHNGLEIFSVFKINTGEKIATDSQINTLKDKKMLFKIRRKTGKILFRNPNIFLSPHHYYEPLYCGFFHDLYQRKSTYFEGYWQNERYIKECKNVDLKKTFVWSSFSEQTKVCSEKLRMDINSVSVHIRKRDKLKNFKQLLYWIRLKIVWRECNLNYYVRAIDIIKSKLNCPQFYVFTNDIKTATKLLKDEPNVVIVDWNQGKDSNQDMFLMTQCKHNIISMSSFSWWGAWLNPNEDKIVISPQKWVARFIKNNDIIPQEWVKI